MLLTEKAYVQQNLIPFIEKVIYNYLRTYDSRESLLFYLESYYARQNSSLSGVSQTVFNGV